MAEAAEYDLVIRRGRIVDGTRMPSYIGDVAVKDGKVAATGKVIGKGTQELDAEGLIVAPGFVDIHTHYDAQVTWANRISPSSWNGVTTVVTHEAAKWMRMAQHQCECCRQ